MISSDDAANAALSFFREWMNSDTKLGVNVTLGSFTATGSGAITSLEDDTLWIRDAASGFSIHVPLTGPRSNQSIQNAEWANPLSTNSHKNLGLSFSGRLIFRAASLWCYLM